MLSITLQAAWNILSLKDRISLIMKKLYIDKSCDICLKYAAYIKSNEINKIEILDIDELKKENFIKKEMVFESDNKYFSGSDAVLESMRTNKSSSIVFKILKMVPNAIRKKSYKIISENRHRISKLFVIIKPKS
ncbi:MAG TPA: DUF393 domain-containing protein [Candidatus Dadabacteria bacterium]|nr:DUF393 domain-containing protein [Candidatus Dadabacteria bacterium]